MTTMGKALSDIISGVSHIESLAEALITTSVDDVLRRVSRDYGIDHKQLVTRYLVDVVQTHSTAACPTTDVQCACVTKNGQRCTKRAVLGGFCLRHVSTGTDEDTKRRRIETHMQNAIEYRKDPVTVMMGQLRVSNDAAYSFQKTSDIFQDLIS
jgi:hypothetical protein